MCIFSIFPSVYKFNSNDLNLLPDAVLIIKKDGSISKFNKKAETEFEIQTKFLKKKNINDLIDNALTRINTAIEEQRVVVIQTNENIQPKSFFELSAKELNKKLLIINLRNVTEEYLTNANLLAELEDIKNTNKNKNLMLVKLSNELQAPLHSIIGFAQSLIDASENTINEKQDKYIKIITRNALDLLSLLNKLISFSQLENNLLHPDYKHFDLINTFTSLINLYNSRILYKNLFFEIEFENYEKRTCFTDETIFKNIITNIMESIIEHTPSGNVKIKIFPTEDEFYEKYFLNKSFNYITFVFNIANLNLYNGDTENFFNPYEEIDKNNKKFFEASLALATAKKMVALLQGTFILQKNEQNAYEIILSIPIEKTEIL